MFIEIVLPYGCESFTISKQDPKKYFKISCEYIFKDMILQKNAENLLYSQVFGKKLSHKFNLSQISERYNHNNFLPHCEKRFLEHSGTAGKICRKRYRVQWAKILDSFLSQQGKLSAHKFLHAGEDHKL